MAGTNPAFNPAVFRSTIKSTMLMGMPTDVSKRLTWHWKREVEFAKQSASKKPYDWTATPTVDLPGNTSVSGDKLVVDYALEFATGTGDETPLGRFDSTRAVVTLLDEDYEKVKTADYATVDDSTYDIVYTAPPMGLFEVTVWEVHLQARDEN